MAIKLIAGTVLGFLTGLGVGGGSLLILWLTIGMGLAQSDARGINLLFFVPSALIACCFRWKQGTLPLKKTWPAIVSGCIAAAVFSWISGGLDMEILKKGFGLLLLITGLRELLWKPK